ncbi:MAG: enoyl-CoA hydratase-related protein [Bacteroidia bacterium]|nr:enoyl-CoA hydratase-related protein [Bacteroidia bacterium]MDW8334641.1 enoyl-CoA hydratase-related protein [Bacteroidia bacterium]
MTYNYLTTELRGRILILTLNRPEAMNALNHGMLEELETALTQAERDETVGAVIVTGAGRKAFAAGADIREIMQKAATYVDALDFSRYGQQLFGYIENYPKPVVAAVNGYALGGGCELAMACHMRVAAQNAKFGQPEVKLGLIAGYGGTQRLPRLIGKTRATQMLLTGEEISATQAEAWGLVNVVCAEGEAVAAAVALLEKCLCNGPLALDLTLEAINAVYSDTENGFDVESEAFAQACISEDAHAGIHAFLNKTPAKFQGR